MPPPTYRLAIGLEYNPHQAGVPLVTTKGEEYVADHIVKLARRFGVPVVEKPALAQALSQFEVDSSIPEQLFEAVALVLWELDRHLTDF